MMTDIDAAKARLRDRVWQALIRDGAAPSDSYGKIPDFDGAAATADRLAAQPEWANARVVKANPDFAQLPVRARALRDGKLLYMAVPRMATLQPFFALDPAMLAVEPDQAATKEGAARVAPRVSVEDMRPIDLVVCGSVAVNRSGARIGKGAGYSDLEVALLIDGRTGHRGHHDRHARARDAGHRRPDPGGAARLQRGHHRHPVRSDPLREPAAAPQHHLARPDSGKDLRNPRPSCTGQHAGRQPRRRLTCPSGASGTGPTLGRARCADATLRRVSAHRGLGTASLGGD
jgi:5-formyltetrahydrofolate cyclo-ligase